MAPARVGLRFMGVAAQALLRTLSKVAGADIVHDAVAFFQAFEGMEEGFRLRAARVRELLVQPGTAFVLVASPRPDSVDEAVHFAGKLDESGMVATALVVNRVQPRFASDDQLARLAPFGDRVTHPGSGPDGALADLVENLTGYTLASDREESIYAVTRGPGDPRPRLPDPAAEHGRPRPRRAGPRGRPPVRSGRAGSTHARLTGQRSAVARALAERRGVGAPVGANLSNVSTILVASDAPTVRAEIAAIAGSPDVTIVEARSGPEVVELVTESLPDLVIVDMQMGNMGGMATTLELRLEASYDKIGHVPVLMLLDRRPDVFLARRSGAEGWLVKPLDPIRLRRAVTALLAGGTYYDESYTPLSVVAAPSGA